MTIISVVLKKALHNFLKGAFYKVLFKLYYHSSFGIDLCIYFDYSSSFSMKLSPSPDPVNIILKTYIQ